MEFSQMKFFVCFVKFVNYIKLLKIQGASCYMLNVTFISSHKDGLKICQIKIPARFQLLLHLKRRLLFKVLLENM